MVDDDGALITIGFNDSIESILGRFILSDSPAAKLQWELFRNNPQSFEFAVGFIGKPQADGTYIECELKEISMIVKHNEQSTTD